MDTPGGRPRARGSPGRAPVEAGSVARWLGCAGGAGGGHSDHGSHPSFCSGKSRNLPDGIFYPWTGNKIAKAAERFKSATACEGLS